MSIESILLAAFLLFPLLERLTRHLRERAAQAQADPAAATPRRPPVPTRRPLPDGAADEGTAAGQTGQPASVPPVVVVAPPLPPRHPAAERLIASERVRAARLTKADVGAPPSALRTSPRPRVGLSLLGGRADLRRAVALMTVLGPCKALENEPARR